MFFAKPARKRHARLLRPGHVDANNISNDRHGGFSGALSLDTLLLIR